MMEQEELEDVLEELYGAGTFDSSGSFSVRADKAREKLAQFRLENPYSYVVHLFSAAYMAGAESFRISMGLWNSELEFKGARLPVETLKDIFASLLLSPQDAQEWAAHELALGLQSGPVGGLKRATVCSENHQVTVVGEKVELSSLEGGSDLRITLTHKRPLGICWNSLVLQKMLPEVQALVAAITPGLITGVVEQRGWKQAYEVSTQPPFDEGLLGISTPNGYVVLGQADGLGKGKDSKIELSIRGRRFNLPAKFGKGRVLALEKSDHLLLNLSQTAPIWSEEFLATRRRLMEQVDELRVRLLLERSDSLSSRDRRTLVRQVSRGQRGRADLEAAQSVLSQITYSEARVAAIKVMQGELNAAEELLSDELERGALPKGLRPVRYFDLATLYARQGESVALETWEKGYKLMEEQHLSRKSHLVSEAIENKLLWLLDLDVDFDSVWADWERASSLKKHLGKEHPRMAVNFERGAYLQWRSGGFEKALELTDKAEEIRVAHLGEGNPAVGQALALRALAANGAGDSKAALGTARRRLSMMRAVYGEEHPETAASLNLISWLETGRGAEQAASILEKRGVAEPFPGKVVVCFRGWFHSRSPWCCCYPLVTVVS
jgi:hypothetical protein